MCIVRFTINRVLMYLVMLHTRFYKEDVTDSVTRWITDFSHECSSSLT